MNIRVLFDEIDKDLAKLGKISRFYSDDDNITITTDYNTYKVNRSMLDGIMGYYGYEFYDYGDNGDKVMLTYNKVSDSRKISDRKHYEGDNNNYTEYKNCDYVIEGGARFSTECEDFQQKTSEATIWVNSNIGKTDFWRNIVIPTLKKKFKNFGYIGYYTWDESSDNVIGVKLVSDNGITDDDVMNVIDEFMLICNQVSDSRKVKDGMDNDIIEKFKNKVMRKVKDSNSDDVLYDLQDRAMSEYDGDIEEAIERAIDDGLIYNEDILALAERYGVVDYSQLITDFYDDLYNDLREYLEDNIEGEEE